MCWGILKVLGVTLHVLAQLTCSAVDLLSCCILLRLVDRKKTLVSLKESHWTGEVEIEVESSHDFLFQIDQHLSREDALLWLREQ